MTPRGHQFPAAFMICASGLDKHGVQQEDKQLQLKYTHLDIAGAVVMDGGNGSGSLAICTGAPVTSLVATVVPYTFKLHVSYKPHVGDYSGNTEVNWHDDPSDPYQIMGYLPVSIQG